MKHRFLKKITGLILAVAMTFSLAPVKAEAQVNNNSSNVINYTQKGNSAWSQAITLQDDQFFAISMTPDIDQTWTFESKGENDTYLKLVYLEDENDISSIQFVEADEGGETSGNFKLTYDLKAGHEYSLHISGFADSACTTTVYGTPLNNYSFEALSEKTFILDSPLSTGSKFPSTCTLEVGQMDCGDNNWAAHVGWYYLDESGKEQFVAEETIHPGLGEIGRLQVDYSNIINGKTVVYIARCSFFDYEQDITFQVTGTSFDSGFKVVSSYCPDYVDADQEATLSVHCESTNRIWYQWYYYDYKNSKYVEIADAIYPSYTAPANSYQRYGKVQYQCRITDEYMDVVQDFELQVNSPHHDEEWTLSAEHDTMRPGEENRLYVTTGPQINLGQYLVTWSRWNEETGEYEKLTSGLDLSYTITPKESDAYSYGTFVTYRCSVTDKNNMIVDIPIQIGISALRDDQITKSYYFDWQNEPLYLETENCSLADPEGSYSYEWTIEGDDDSYCVEPVKLSSDTYYYSLNEQDMDEIEGDYVVSCRTTDNTLKKSSLCRFYVYNHCFDHFKVFYESEVEMDYTNGIDLEVLTVNDDSVTHNNAITYKWYRNSSLISGQTGNRLHISPQNFVLTDKYVCKVSDGYSTYNCSFTVFNNKPVSSNNDQNPEKPAYDEGCERIWTSTYSQYDISQKIQPNSKYVFEFRGNSVPFKKGTYQIKVTGVDSFNGLEYALYDDDGERIPIVSRQEGGNIWIRFETTDSRNYHLFVNNPTGFYLNRTISIKPFDITANESNRVIFRNASSVMLPVNYSKPLTFYWHFGNAEPQDTCETVFLVDGRIVKSGTNLKEFVPSLRYDVNGDGIEDITIRVNYQGYWHEATTRVYFKTLLFESPMETFNRSEISDKITVAKGQTIQLNYNNFWPSHKSGSYFDGKLVNYGSNFRNTWYKSDDPDLTTAKNVTKISSNEESCMVDTGNLGTVYYIAELTNGIDTCTVTYEIEVVDGSEMQGGQIGLYGTSMTIFDTGLLYLNAFIQIPSSIIDSVASINDKSLNELEFMGNNFDSNAIYSVYKLSFPIIPAELSEGKDIHIYDKDGSEIRIPDPEHPEWSITGVSAISYLDTFLNDEEFLEENPQYSVYTDLAKKLLLYCNAAHEYFAVPGYDGLLDLLQEEDRVNEEIPEHVLDTYTLSDYYVSSAIDDKIAGIRYHGSSLLIKSGLTLRHYFMLNQGQKITDFSFVSGSMKLNPIKKGNVYYVDIPDIPISNVSEPYNIKITKTGTKTYSSSFSYSPMNYLKKWKESNSSPEVQNLIKALYWISETYNNY